MNDNFEMYLEDLGKEWKENTPRYNMQELVDIFGRDEVREILKDKILEAEYPNKWLNFSYKNKREYIEFRFKDFEQYFMLKLLELTLGEEVAESNKRLKHYSIWYLKLKGKLQKPKQGYDDAQLQQAREFPVENLITGRIRLLGTRKTTTCPFHKEKTPSFVIYDDNSFHCFGCAVHGNNAIDFVIKRDNLNFKEAVEVLL